MKGKRKGFDLDSYEHAFEGVWIEAGLWFNSDLSIPEKVLYALIRNLDTPEHGCYASNEYFARFFGLTETRISQMVKSLKDKGFIVIEGFTGRKRIIRAAKGCLKTSFKAALKQVSSKGVSTIYDNKEYNKGESDYSLIEGIFNRYCRETGKSGGKTASVFAIRKLLSEQKITPEIINEAIDNYLERMTDDVNYRIFPKNFFGERIHEFMPKEEFNDSEYPVV